MSFARKRMQRPAAIGKWLVSLPPLVYLIVFFFSPR